jgi:hypothetical protein
MQVLARGFGRFEEDHEEANGEPRDHAVGGAF